jgi:hypothetical protein
VTTPSGSRQRTRTGCRAVRSKPYQMLACDVWSSGSACTLDSPTRGKSRPAALRRGRLPFAGRAPEATIAVRSADENRRCFPRRVDGTVRAAAWRRSQDSPPPAAAPLRAGVEHRRNCGGRNDRSISPAPRPVRAGGRGGPIGASSRLTSRSRNALEQSATRRRTDSARPLRSKALSITWSGQDAADPP